MFSEDLIEWKKAEREFASKLVLTWRVYSMELPQGKFSDYDLKVKTNLGESTYEVKVDGIYPTTKKIWFEFECSGKPSWVFVSKADYIVYKLWDEFYYTERPRLLNLLAASKDKEFVQWGDNGTAKLWIIPEEEFYTIARKL